MSDLELSIGVENVSAEDAPPADPAEAAEAAEAADAPVGDFSGRFGENVPGVGGVHYSNESFPVVADEAPADEAPADEAPEEEEA